MESELHRNLHQFVCVCVCVCVSTGQTYSQLCTMESELRRSLEQGLGDAEFEEAVLHRLKIYKVRVTHTRTHTDTHT